MVYASEGQWEKDAAQMGLRDAVLLKSSTMVVPWFNTLCLVSLDNWIIPMR